MNIAAIKIPDMVLCCIGSASSMSSHITATLKLQITAEQLYAEPFVTVLGF
jgi:hypothetical protein